MKMLKVLLVEDDNDHAELLRVATEKQRRVRINLVRVDNLTDGLRRLEEDYFDAVLLDLSLPDSDSAETVKKICHRFPLATVVVLTSLVDVEAGKAAIADGAQDFLSKGRIAGEVIAGSLIHSIERKRIAIELVRRNEELRNFAGLVAHEVKKPLQAISLALHYIEEGESEKLSERSQKFLGIGKTAMDDIVGVTNELLQFAEVGGPATSHANISLNEIVDGAVAIVSLEKGCSTDVVARDHLPDAFGSKVSIKHVFQNLISNAIQYCGDREPQIKITAKPYSEDVSRLQISVEDQGIGISGDDCEAVFKLFYRADPDGEVSGTGIGLGFCRQVIEAHGGTIWAEPNEEDGCTFHFTLPVAVVD